MWKASEKINMKLYKILFVAWIGIFILAFGGIGVVSLMSQNKTFNAELHVNNIKKINDGYLYNARIKHNSDTFNSDDILNIDIVKINYDTTINADNIKNLTRKNDIVEFTSIDYIGTIEIGKIMFKVSFAPLVKILIKYFIYGILAMIGIGIIYGFGSRIKIYDLISNTKYIQETRNTIMDFVAQRGFVKLLSISSAIYLIALFALIRGDVYYMDDWARALGDGEDWDALSRYVATFSYTMINVFKEFPYTDISPLPQFLAILLLSISGLIMSYVIRKKIDLLGVIAALPLGLSPYYLENISYKFDSFTMSLSILFCVIPFLFKDRLKYFGLFSIIGIILSLSTYQASNGIYIVLSMYLVIAMYIFSEKSNVDICKFILTAMLSFIVGMAIYKYLIITPTDASFHVGVSAMSLSQILKGGNILSYLTLLYMDLKNLPFFALMIISMFLFIVSIMINSNKSIYMSLIVSIAFLSIGAILSYGAYLVLAKPLFLPRAFIGFGGFVSIIMIVLLTIQNTKKLYFVNAVFVCLLGYSLIIFASAYGNAMTKQQEYTMYRAGIVIKDMANIVDKSKNEKISIMLKGSTGYSPATQNFINRYSIKDNRIVRIIMEETRWSSHQTIRHFGMNFKDYAQSQLDCEKIKDDSKNKLIISNAFHNISQAGNCYIVELKNYR